METTEQAVQVTTPRQRRVGTFTLGIVLVTAGAGMLAAFRPQSLRVQVEGRWLEVEGYLALMPEGQGPRGCDGIFHPRMIQMAASAQQKGGVVHGGR